MMQTNNLLWGVVLLLTILSLTSCSEEKCEPGVDRLLTFFGKIEEDYTRNANPSLQGSVLEKGLQVGLFISEADSYEWKYDNKMVTSLGDGTFVCEEKLYEPFSGQTDVYAYAPYSENFSGKYAEEVTFTIQEDQTTDENYLASDLLLGSADNPVSSRNIMLKFAHQMSKIRINFVSDEYNLEGARVIIHGIVPTANVNLKDRSISVDGDAEKTNIKVVNFDSDASEFECAAIIVPQTLQATKKFFDITLANGMTFAYPLDQETIFQSKKCYEYNVTIGKPYTGDPIITEIQDVEQKPIIGALRGSSIRIVGKRMKEVERLFCNGIEVKPTQKMQNYVMLDIPADLPINSEDENYCKIRMEFVEGDPLIYKFKFRDGQAPVITDVSWNLATVGQKILLVGQNFTHIEEIIFPGNVKADDYRVINTDTIEVTVPQNGDQQMGAITLVGLNGGACSVSNINCQSRLLDWDIITANTNDCKSQGKVLDETDFTDIESKGGVLPANRPETIYGVVESVFENFLNESGSSESPVISGFKLNWTEVAENCGVDALCTELAFQVDYYCPWNDWGTGAFRLSLNKTGGTEGKDRYSITPWYVNKKVQPIQFGGQWRTLTIPLYLFSTLVDLNLGQILQNTAWMEKTYFVFRTGAIGDGGRGNKKMPYMQILLAYPRVVSIVQQQYVEPIKWIE